MIDFDKLAEPFPEADIEWRIGRAGRTNGRIWATCVCYMNSRAVMDRLDEVVGHANWQTRIEERDGRVRFGLGIRMGDDWIWRWDGADVTVGAGDESAMKGGATNGLKRAAVQFGIGRYLYRLPEGYAKEVSDTRRDGWEYGSFKEGNQRVKFWWLPPDLPAWAVPAGSPTKADPPPGVDPATGEVDEGTKEDETSAPEPEPKQQPKAYTVEERTTLTAAMSDLLARDEKLPTMSATETRWIQDMLRQGKDADWDQVERGIARLKKKYPELVDAKERAA